MAINRYNLPAEQPIAQTYVPLPYQEILAATEAQQKAYDDLEAQRQALADTDFYALDPDLDYVTNMQNTMLADVEKVGEAYATGDLRQARKLYNDIDRKWKKELNPLTGLTGAAMAQYDKRAEFYKQILENKDLNPTQRQKAMEYFDKEYATKGGVGLDPKNMGSYSTEELAKWINPTEWADKYGKGFLSDMNAEVAVGPNGGYIIKRKGTHEYVSDQEIQNTLLKYAQADPEMMAWLEQGERMGYSSKQMVLDAITGATGKYAFDKFTKDEDWQKDWLYERKLDDEKEAALNKSFNVGSKQEIIEDELTDKFNQESNFLEDADALEVFTSVNADKRREMTQLEKELNTLGVDLGTLTNTASLKGDARIKAEQYLQLQEDMQQNEQLRESFIKNSYGIDNQYLAENGYNNVDEYLADVKATNQKVESILEIKDKASQAVSADELSQTYADDNVAFSFNEDGSINDFTYSPPAGTQKSLSITKLQEIRGAIDAYNANVTLKGLDLDKEFEGSTIITDPQKFEEQYYANLKAEETAQEKASYYINNRTITSPQSFISEAVKDTPYFQQVENYLNLNELTFEHIDPKTGKKSAYSKESALFEADKEEWFRTGAVKAARSNIEFAGYEANNRTGEVYVLATHNGKLIKTNIKDSNIKEQLNAVAYNDLISSTPGTAAHGDALQLYAATSSDPLYANLYSTAVKELKDLPDDVTSGDKKEVILSNAIPMGHTEDGTAVSSYISVDNTGDRNGRVYNVYTPGLSKSEIEAIEEGREGVYIDDNLDLRFPDGTLAARKVTYGEILPTLILSAK